jgi:large subunit ribosomal protein L45
MSGSVTAHVFRRLHASSSSTQWRTVINPMSSAIGTDFQQKHGLNLNHQTRGYAKGGGMSAKSMERSITPPAFASQSRGQQIRAFLKSPGVIADPYRGPRPWPSLSSFFKGTGFKELGKFLLRPVQDVWTLGQCQSINGFTRPQFREEAKQLYTEINRMISLNNHTALRHICSERALTEIKREVKQREKGGWSEIKWNLVEFEAGTPRVVQGRTVAPTEQDRSVSFVQFTVIIKSKQTWVAYDKKGNVVAGDPNEILNVEDFWVFEHGLKVPNPRWRLAARLSTMDLGQTVGGQTLDPTIGTPNL